MVELEEKGGCLDNWIEREREGTDHYYFLELMKTYGWETNPPGVNKMESEACYVWF